MISDTYLQSPDIVVDLQSPFPLRLFDSANTDNNQLSLFLFLYLLNDAESWFLRPTLRTFVWPANRGNRSFGQVIYKFSGLNANSVACGLDCRGLEPSHSHYIFRRAALKWPQPHTWGNRVSCPIKYSSKTNETDKTTGRTERSRGSM